MRKTIYIVLVALGLCLFAGCGSSDKEKVSPTAKLLVGEWQLKTWTGETPQDFDIYLSFDADNTFEIYQRLAEVKYQKFTGSYQVQNDVLSGKYSGGKNFGSTYDISFNESGSTLTLTSATNVTEVSVYERSTIPNSVKEGAAVMKSTRSAVRRCRPSAAKVKTENLRSYDRRFFHAGVIHTPPAADFRTQTPFMSKKLLYLPSGREIIFTETSDGQPDSSRFPFWHIFHYLWTKYVTYYEHHRNSARHSLRRGQ